MKNQKTKSRKLFVRLVECSFLAGAVLFGGCATTSEQSDQVASVDASIPGQWNNAGDGFISTHANLPDLTEWWKQFRDPTLNQLIEQALSHNPDIRSAVLKVEQVRLQKELVMAQKLPSTALGLSTSGSRVDYLDADGHSNSDSASLSLSTSWEVDVFGKQQASINSAEATYKATIEDYYGVQVSLAAEVASTYLSLRSLQSQYDIVKQTIQMREQTLQMTRWQEEAGEVNALQVQQAIVSLEQAKTSIPSLEQNIEETLNSLDLLCGEQPGTLRKLLATEQVIPLVPANLAVSIPAETLAQRPDIRAQRMRIESELSSLSAAEKDRLPSLNLSGSIGLSEGRFADLLNPAQVIMNIAGKLSAPIWDAGRIEKNIELQNVSLKQAYLRYDNLVLNALNEVENSLLSISKIKQQYDQVKTATEAARVSADLADIQYEAGEVDLLSVLDSQRSLLSLEQNLISTQVQQLNAYIQLYKAMGGGWTSSETI